jgi:hypothetical protein
MLAECLATRAKPYYSEMTQKQKVKYSLTVINEILLDMIFPSLEEKTCI